jgi:glutathione S-transferase
MRKSTKIAKEDPMELFFAPLACSMSARIALNKAGAAINLIEVDTHVRRVLPTGEDYRAINPLGYVPALRLDNGTVVTENSAILQTPPEVKAWAVNKYGPRLAYLDEKLKGREFLLDRFSVADGYLTTVLNWTRATPEIDLSAYPNVKAYLERMRARPSVAEALKVELPLFQAEMARRKAA